LIQTFRGHSTYVSSLAVLKNGYLASGDDSGKIFIRDVDIEILELIQQGSSVVAMAVLSNNDDLVSSD
jgi:WD40 repeat protein